MRPQSPGIVADLKQTTPWAIASGVLCALLFYPFDLWFLAPVALVPLLLALGKTSSVRAAAYLAIIFGATFAAISLHWLWSIFSTGTIAVAVLISIPWGLFGAAYRLLTPRLSPVAMLLTTPTLFVAAEWIRCQGWYFRFSWLQIGSCYVASQSSQSTYPLVGIYGMTFLTVLVSAAIVMAVTRPERPARQRGLLATAALVAALALFFRAAWVTELQHRVESYGRAVKVLLVQSETEDLDWFLSTTRQYATTRPQLIVWPELALADYAEDDPRTMQRLRELTRSLNTTLVFGCKSHLPPGVPCDWLRRRAMLQSEGELYYNSALIMAPSGEIIGRYHKRHPIQFFADGVPGPGYPVFQAPWGKLGAAICYDLDFADTSLQLARNGAELLVVPTFDARDWGRVQQMQHARLALARAAEVGRCVVRPTSSGVSQIIAPGGEQVTFIPTGPASAITGLVGMRGDLTPYTKATWRLPQACLLISIVMLLWATIRRRRALRRG